MYPIVKKAGLAVALGATALTVAAPAQAQRWHHRHHHGGDDAAAAAIVGGIIGLGLGAAIASSDNDRYDRRYYYDDYYDRGYYAPPPRYYSYRYDYRPRCYTQRRWDPYYGRHVRVRVCR
ncbi:MAG TPA: hypothetical protein VM657_09240 [Sphingomonas sp.]|nr:hypothetical protein [Sphingomonas sp.]